MSWTELGWEFAKSAVAVPITIASAWVAFRWATRRGDVEAYTAQLVNLRAAAWEASTITDAWMDALDDEDFPEMTSARRHLIRAYNRAIHEGSSAQSLSTHIGWRRKRVAMGLAYQALTGILGGLEPLRHVAGGSGSRQWAADWHQTTREPWRAQRWPRSFGGCTWL